MERLVFLPSGLELLVDAEVLVLCILLQAIPMSRGHTDEGWGLGLPFDLSLEFHFLLHPVLLGLLHHEIVFFLPNTQLFGGLLKLRVDCGVVRGWEVLGMVVFVLEVLET